MTEKRIYKDFNDWWQRGNHGCSSASRDVAEATWADFEPTIQATRDDYTALMLREVKEMHERYIDHLRGVTAYVTEHNLEAVVGAKLYRWLLDRRVGRTPSLNPRLYRYEGNEYAVVREVRMMHPVSGEWVAAYEYVNRDEPATVYVHEKGDFDAKFESFTETPPES